MAARQENSKPGMPRGRGKKAASKSSNSLPEPNPSERSEKPSISDRPTTNPDLFTDHNTSRIASALPIWEASNILTQRHHLPWSSDADGKLCYAKDVGNGQGAIHFWVTENLEDEFPVPLAGAAALAVVDAFDIRAACMHLIYAASATQLDRPWEKELIIDDRQIESYLGLKKRTDMNRQEKLALIEEIAKQPCKITTFISWPTQGKVKGFTLEEGRLWHLMGIRYHYQQSLLGEKELTGMTFIVKAGLWAKYFLNEEGKKSKTALYQSGLLPKALLEAVMSVWQHREGAARLMVWLLFKAQFNRQYPLNVQSLMEVAYGVEKIEQARHNSELRKKLANSWDEDLMTLHDRGWKLNFDLETYPLSIQPSGFGRETTQRPRGFFEQLLSARLWITPEDSLLQEASSLHTAEDHNLPPSQPAERSPLMILTGSQVRAMRIAKGWSQRKLASLTGMSQGLISLIENEERTITPENEAILSRTFESTP
jgi:DNA-binding XRE family transcriptional regulator